MKDFHKNIFRCSLTYFRPDRIDKNTLQCTEIDYKYDFPIFMS